MRPDSAVPRMCLLAACALVALVAACTDSTSTPTRGEEDSLDARARSIQHVYDDAGRLQIQRVFKEPIPHAEYLRLAEREMELRRGGAGAASGPAPATGFVQSALETCAAPDADYDGDGFTDTDTLPLRSGPHVADRPLVTAEFTSSIQPGVEVKLSGTTTTSFESYTYYRNDLKETTTASDVRELKRKFGSSFSLKLNFKDAFDPFGAWKKVFTLAGTALGLDGSYEKSRARRWEHTKVIESERKFYELQKQVSSQTKEWVPYGGRVTSQLEVRNDSDYGVDLAVDEVLVNVVAYSPYTGAKVTLGDVRLVETLHLGFGAPYNYQRRFVQLPGLETESMVQYLTQGWVFDMEYNIARSIKDAATGVELLSRISQINQRTASVSVHYGDDSARRSRLVSLFSRNGGCVTGKELIENLVGPGNAEFERLANGQLIVKRINHRTNRHADRDFDLLTPTEQAEYGAWLVGFDSTMQEPTFDLENTMIRPRDKLLLYYLTAVDYGKPLAAPDQTRTVKVANDATAPVSTIALEGVRPNDVIELTVKSSFQTYAQFSESRSGQQHANCTYFYTGTWWDGRVQYDSANSDPPLDGGNFYGLQIQFPNTANQWWSVKDLVADGSLKTELVTLRGYPHFDVVLRFRATPAMLAGQTQGNLHVRQGIPRDNLKRGYDPGWMRVGTFTMKSKCTWQEDFGFRRNDVTAKLWNVEDGFDFDFDGMASLANHGIDFDDSNSRRFPGAPEHLDGLDNDGDGAIDEGAILCPASTASYETGICELDNRAGWYGTNPTVIWDHAWKRSDGSTTWWERSETGGVRHGFTMYGGTNDALLVRATVGGRSATAQIAHAKTGTTLPLFSAGSDVEAEAGRIVAPMTVEGGYITSPAGTLENSGSAQYKIRVSQQGGYVLDTLVSATSAADDSFHVVLFRDDGVPYDFGYGSDAHFRLEFSSPPYGYAGFAWTSVGHYNAYTSPVQALNPITYSLLPGDYVVQVKPREAGTKLDKLKLRLACGDADGDGYTTCGGDCDDGNGGVYPGAYDSCDGVDNNCNGAVDEDCGCMGYELCGDWVDNDCDGWVDEDCGGCDPRTLYCEPY